MINVNFKGMGLFDTELVWIHPDKIEKTYEIIYVTAGTIYLYEEEKEYTLKKGDLILLKPDVKHGGLKKSEGHTSFYWVHFSGEIPPDLSEYYQNFIGTGMFRELIHYDNLPFKDEDALRIITEHIILNIKEAKDSESKNKLSKEVYEWIRINIKVGLTSKSVAEHFGYNYEHLSRIMKKEYGVTLKKIIDNLLCDKFESLLLNTNYSIKEISSILNFSSDLSVCVNFFKYHKKTSPTQYRKRYSEIHMNLK